MTAPKAKPNNKNLAGKLASKKVFFGDFKRYAVAAIHTRFGSLQWFVWDSERIDELTNLPAVIRQESSFEAAIRNF